jgi:hypothetical protein
VNGGKSERGPRGRRPESSRPSQRQQGGGRDAHPLVVSVQWPAIHQLVMLKL